MFVKMLKRFHKGVGYENEMLALILAGGQGTRLGKLTQSIAKPAVQFAVIIVLLISRCRTVPTLGLTMLV